MPSPFPGMNPYLEDPTLWPGVHQRLITYAADALQPKVRPRYHARIGERLYVVEPPYPMYPNIVLVRRPRAVRESVTIAPMADLATLEVDTPVVLDPSGRASGALPRNRAHGGGRGDHRHRGAEPG